MQAGLGSRRSSKERTPTALVMPALAAALATALLGGGCYGRIRIHQDDGGAGGAGGGDGSCTSSSQCGAGHICSGGRCVTTDDQCSINTPQGSCPAGRICIDGVCRLDGGNGGSGGSGSGGSGGNNGDCVPDCTPSQVCLSGTCTEVASNPCSATNPTGLCQPGLVCVGGNCVPLYPTVYCSTEHPNCLCPPGSGCDGTFCRPLEEEPCNLANQAGLCPAGQICIDGSCSRAACSFTQPCGACTNLDLVCIDSICTDEHELTTCEALDCPAQNRLGCDASGTVPVCLACIAGFVESSPGGPCVSAGCFDLGCESNNRECDESGPTAACGGCLTGYHPPASGNGACLVDTCADIQCDLQHRLCNAGPPPSCGDCAPGYSPSGGSCVQADCTSLGCAALHRDCNAGSPACLGCLATYHEHPTSGLCVQCERTADCPAGEHCEPATGCEKECDQASLSCPSLDQECDPYGRCISDGPVVTEGICAAGISEGELVEPIVMLLLDQSGSMDNDYPTNCTSSDPICDWRWNVLRDVLFGTVTSGDYFDGVVWPLEDVVKFGSVFYTHNGSSEEYDCPDLTNISINPAGVCSQTGGACVDGGGCSGSSNVCRPVVPADVTGAGAGTTPIVNNGSAMRTLMDGLGPAGSTPTAESISALTDYLLWLNTTEKKYILLATDGDPNRCDNHGATGTALSQQRVVEAAARAFANDIRLFMVSVGPDVNNQHMQDVANAGAGTGLPSGSPPTTPGSAPFFVANDPLELQRSLSDVIGRTLSCVIQLNAVDEPVLGNVYIDGDPAVQGTDWVITGTDRITLQGAACTRVTDGLEHHIVALFTVCGGG